MWLVLSIAAGAMAVALLLAYVLKRRVGDDGAEVYSKPHVRLTPPSVIADGFPRYSSTIAAKSEVQKLEVRTMTTLPPVQTPLSSREPEHRRSSRIERVVPLMVLGTNRLGEPFQESTSAVSLNLHGCRYSSRHDYALEGRVTLQLTGTEGAGAAPIRARVRSISLPKSPRDLSQVGVELDTPGNVWGISFPPDDWQGFLTGHNGASRPASAATATQDSVSPLTSAIEKHFTSPDRKAEVTMFPGPAAPLAAELATAEPTTAAPPTGKPQGTVLTAEELLEALQSRLQEAADRAVQNAISTHLHDAINAALNQIDDVWKANVRHAEEFSGARLAEVQNRWEKELVVYRSRAEELARRLEVIAADIQQNFAASQSLLERLTTEIEPQFHTRLDQTFSNAKAELEAQTAHLSEQQVAALTQASQSAARDVLSGFEATVAEVRSLLANAPPAASEERLESLVNSSREHTLNHLEERLGEIWRQFEQQQDLVRGRTGEMAQQLERLSGELRQAQSQHDQAIAEVRSQFPSPDRYVAPEQLDSRFSSAQQQFHDLLEWRLGEVSAHFERLHDAVRQRTDEIAQRLESFTGEARSRLDETRRIAEGVQQTLPQSAAASIDESAARAVREIETSAARISDRQLTRLMEQKQVLAREVALELEARAGETRALLQKSANSTLDEAQHRIEAQMEQIVAEATERAVSTLATLDAENRAACEERRRAMEIDIARAAEQSTAEFRASIKAFLYSCLVAAVSAVDEHAQNAMASLVKEPAAPALAIEEAVATSEAPEIRASAATASSSGSSEDSQA